VHCSTPRTDLSPVQIWNPASDYHNVWQLRTQLPQDALQRVFEHIAVAGHQLCPSNSVGGSRPRSSNRCSACSRPRTGYPPHGHRRLSRPQESARQAEDVHRRRRRGPWEGWRNLTAVIGKRCRTMESVRLTGPATLRTDRPTRSSRINTSRHGFELVGKPTHYHCNFEQDRLLCQSSN
jgi:hypothetical protein